MASSSEWYQCAPDGVLKILRPRGCRGSDWPPWQIADLRRRPGVSRARSTARLWLNFGCSRLARLMSLRAAATERDVRHGVQLPQRRGLHAPLASGLIRRAHRRRIVAQGDVVEVGQALVVLEAMKMKMESTLAAEVAGRVTSVRAVAGASVAAGDVLVEITAA